MYESMDTNKTICFEYFGKKKILLCLKKNSFKSFDEKKTN